MSFVTTDEDPGTLVVVFGAGASYDSNPDQRPKSAGDLVAFQQRPPLASELFDMEGDTRRGAAAAFPRVAPALMAARADLKAGGTIEQTLSRLQDESLEEPRARSQLMAVRFYLQRVLTEIPDAWNTEAVRQTTYVSMLDQLARWQRVTGQRLCLVTFNYDKLLEYACEIVFGHSYGALQDYQKPRDVHVYKPHGSVNWALATPWDGPTFGDQDQARRRLCDDPAVEPEVLDFEVRGVGRNVIENVKGRTTAYLPALAIPVELKPAMVMPTDHEQAMRADLSQASAVLAVGWRAREQHFLQVLQEHLPSHSLPLYAVSHATADAEETVGKLWTTGRFDRYAAIDGGFSGFAAPEPALNGPPRPARSAVLSDVLRAGVPMTMAGRGRGVGSEPAAPSMAYSRQPYAALGPPAAAQDASGQYVSLAERRPAALKRGLGSSGG